MKLRNIIIFIFIILLVSCSRDDMMGRDAENNRVSISVEMPSDIAATRSIVTIPTTHRLRFIIEVWTKASTPSLKYRQEKAVDGGTVPVFDFELSRGDYECLLWADFIAKDTPAIEAVTADGIVYTHFEDTFYDTSSLKAVSVKDETGANLFDTDLSDGFFANLEIKKTDDRVDMNMKMKRPFAKLIVKETNKEKFTTLKELSVSYTVPKQFNVATGMNGDATLLVTYNKKFSENDDSQILFTQYVFSSSTGLPMESMNISFTTASGKTECEVPAGSITLVRNQQLVASGNLMEGGAIAPEPDPEPGNNPNVGDYYFIDGTWSSELTEANKSKCIGIVYATEAFDGDNLASYGAEANIKGYVMALKNTGSYKELFPTETMDQYLLSGRPYFYKQNEDKSGKDDAVAVLAKPTVTASWVQYNGYELTQTLLDDTSKLGSSGNYPALYIFSHWKEEHAHPANASEWYIPSSGQLLQAAGVCYGFEPNEIYKGNGATQVIEQDQAFSEALSRAVELGVAENFSGTSANGYFLYTSTLNKDSMPMVIQIGTKRIAPHASPNYKTMGLIRPFLTILN